MDNDKTGAATATTAATMPTVSAFGAMPDIVTQAPPIPQTPTRERTKKATNSMYDQIGRTVAYIGMIGIGALLWYIGAFYTLAALRSVGLQTNGLIWWLVPAIITAIELWFMPKRSTGWQTLIAFCVVLLIDVGTSWQGLTSFAGKTLPLFGGIQLPASGGELHMTAAIFALVVAFLPEKLVRAGILEIKKAWL